MNPSARPDSAIMVFARRPQPGKVKTRLIPALGAERACELHRRLLAYTLQQASRCRVAELQLWLTGTSSMPSAGSPDIPAGLPLFEQCEGDLGARMAQGFRYNFAAGKAAVLVVGCDCPELIACHYLQVLALLRERDAVVIPARDGGYVMLGLRQFHPALFAGMPWGGEQVLAETLDRIEALGWTRTCLESLSDIDRPEDLPLLAPSAQRQTGFFSQEFTRPWPHS